MNTTAIERPAPRLDTLDGGDTSYSSFIRTVDLAARLAEPPSPRRFRVHGLAKDGCLTVVAGPAGVGKSWFGIALARAVQAGRPICEMQTRRGVAVYVDGEMGEAMMVERCRDAGIEGDEFIALDVHGLDLGAPAGRAALEAHLRRVHAQFVVIDSLRRLAPGKRENESDDMAPLVGALAAMARRLNAAIILLHHSGHGDGARHFSRGSTAIADQADALFGLVPAGDGVLELSADATRGGKVRFARAPEARTLRLAVGESHDVVVTARRVRGRKTRGAHLRRRDELRDVIAARRAAGHVEPLADLADVLGLSVDNKNLRNALRDVVSLEQASGGGLLANEITTTTGSTTAGGGGDRTGGRVTTTGRTLGEEEAQ